MLFFLKCSFNRMMDPQNRSCTFWHSAQGYGTSPILPASFLSTTSVLTDVVLEIPRGEEAPERLTLNIDEFGEAWETHGMPVTNPETVATLSFRFENQPLSIELPFVAPADADVMNPHTAGKE